MRSTSNTQNKNPMTLSFDELEKMDESQAKIIRRQTYMNLPKISHRKNMQMTQSIDVEQMRH